MMVEITYQVVLSTLQTIALIVGIIYYLIIMRNSNKARRIQIVENLNKERNDLEFNQIGVELLSMQWTDFEDFRKKYDSTTNPENFAKRWKWWSYWDGIGYMLHEGLIDVESIYNIIGSLPVIQHWMKFQPIIVAQREYYKEPHWFIWWEYLFDEITKKRENLGLKIELTNPDIYEPV